MTVEPRKLAPDRAQVTRSRRDGNAHNLFDGLAVGLAMDETADPANAFRHIDKFEVILLLDQFLQAAVDKSNRGPRLDHLFVLHYQVEVDGFRQHRVLRTEGDNGSSHNRLVNYDALSNPMNRNGGFRLSGREVNSSCITFLKLSSDSALPFSPPEGSGLGSRGFHRSEGELDRRFVEV